MGDLLDDYALATTMGIKAWDEMFEEPGVPRPSSQSLHDVLSAMPAEEFDARAKARDAGFTDRGITFQLSGKERPWPLDLIPRVIPDDEWSVLESGVAQRVRALEEFLADVYGQAKILDDGIVPRRLITTSAHMHRAAYGVQPPNGVRIQVAGIDVVRGADGKFYVLEDNIRCPSGISYVVENRKMLSRIFPELFSHNQVRPVDAYPSHLLGALRAAAPVESSDQPTVVVLTPGIYNSAYFEHSFLARQMGVELVEGRDLLCRNDVVYMRTTEGEQRVDVIYRRIDDDFLDPMHFRGDSVVGCPGLLNAARAGNVTIANAVGNGVADDKLIYTYVPDIIRYYLNEEPILPNVTTYRLEEPDQFAEAIGQLDKLVLKPVSGSGGKGVLIGPQASDVELAEARETVTANPREWIAQELVALSTAPTRIGDRLAPRHLDLRPFAVNDGKKVWVVPGGLTRVALPEGGMVVNSSQGGGSKDTWVTYRTRVTTARTPDVTPELTGEHRPARPPETGPGTPSDDVERQKEQHQQQQQQQQQQGVGPC